MPPVLVLVLVLMLMLMLIFTLSWVLSRLLSFFHLRTSATKLILYRLPSLCFLILVLMLHIIRCLYATLRVFQDCMSESLKFMTVTRARLLIAKFRSWLVVDVGRVVSVRILRKAYSWFHSETGVCHLLSTISMIC